jgi:hypothetical protein
LWETGGMPERELRFGKETPNQTIGVCSYCNKQFKSHLPRSDQAKWEISTRFAEHKCKSEDTSQAAGRIVRSNEGSLAARSAVRNHRRIPSRHLELRRIDWG